MDFAICNIEKEIKRKKQIKFTLDNNEKDNKRKMEMIQYEALKLKYTQDTATVVVIILSDSITYGDFISIFDMCLADGHNRYASWDDKFVIFGEWPQKKIEKSDFICFLCNDVLTIKQPPLKLTLIDLVKNKINQYYTPQGLYVLLGWFVLLTIFLISKRKSSMIKSKNISIAGILN